MKTPVTSAGLKQHLTYNWWKYLLIIAVAVGLVDMLYSVTAYRPPREKTLCFCVYGYMDESGLSSYLDQVRETEMSDMEEITARLVMDDSYYGPMQIMAYLSAGDVDLFLLSREEFLTYAASGSLVRLEDDQELISIFDSAGMSLQSGWRRETETGETHLYGIPQEKLPGLSRYAWVTDGYLCMIISSGNKENASKLLRIICRDCITAPEQTAAPVQE